MGDCTGDYVGGYSHADKNASCPISDDCTAHGDNLCNLSGASAQTVENTVTQIIEQQMNGLDGLRYISSNSAGNGQASINLNFEQGIDPDIAQVQVQNKLQSATALLPEDVQRQGVKVTKSGASFMQVLAFYSPDGSLSASDIKDYVNSNISEPLSRVAGVGELQVFGGSYAMRIWLDPAKMTSLQITPSDVATAINAQNSQVAVGQLGGAPSVQGQVLNATVNAQSMLQTPEQFRNIFLKIQLQVLRFAWVMLRVLNSGQITISSTLNLMVRLLAVLRLNWQLVQMH